MKKKLLAKKELNKILATKIVILNLAEFEKQVEEASFQ